MQRLGVTRARGLLRACPGLVLLAVMSAPVMADIVLNPFYRPEIPLIYDRGRNVSVTERARPEYVAEGIDVGSFNLSPRVGVGGGYTDNVYGSETNVRDDQYLQVDPGLSVNSLWSRHALQATADVHLLRFVDAGEKDRTDYETELRARVDLVDDSHLDFGGALRSGAEDRVSSGFPQDVPQVKFREGAFFASTLYEQGRARAILAVDYTVLDFRDSISFAGAPVDQDYRNRSVGRVSARGEFAISPDASLFLQAGVSNIDYEGLLDDGSPNRDATETRVLAGTSFDASALIRGSFGVGFVRRSLENAQYSSIDGLTWEARLEYFLTSLTTVTLSSRRYIDEATVGASGGVFSTGTSLRVDHELLRNLLLEASASLSRDSFDGIRRQDRAIVGALGAHYLLSPELSLKLRLERVDSRSRGELPNGSYRENRAFLSVSLQR